MAAGQALSGLKAASAGHLSKMSAMTEEHRYLFDLQGYLVVPAALPAAFVKQINEAIDGLERLDDPAVAVHDHGDGHAFNVDVGPGDLRILKVDD